MPQCGYCQSGQLMAAAALLNSTPNPSDADTEATLTNLCRCATYARIRKGVRAAAAKMPAPAVAPALDPARDPAVGQPVPTAPAGGAE